MGLSYGWEKLHSAVLTLCGQGKLAQRLEGAIYSLIRITPEEDLPEEIRSEFQDLIKNITAIEAQGKEGKIQATINSLNEVELTKMAEKIVSLYDTVCRHSEPL